MKNLHFLSGIQRSGSTLLTKLLNQNPETFATSTSPFFDYLAPASEKLQQIKTSHSSGHYVNVNLILKETASAFYSFTDKPTIIDKHRGWSSNYENIERFLTPNPKIILTLRPVEEVVTSFYSILYKNNTPDTPSKIFQGYIAQHLAGLKESSKYASKFHLVTYKDITTEPDSTLKKVEDYLGVANHSYDFQNIVDIDPENDSMWGIKNLHTIRSSITVQSLKPSDIMTRSELEYCQQKTKELYTSYNLPC